MTPPGSPHLAAPSPAMTGSTCSNTGGQLWKTRLTNIKNSFLGSPRFHRRKMQGIVAIFVCFSSTTCVSVGKNSHYRFVMFLLQYCQIQQ